MSHALLEVETVISQETKIIKVATCYFASLHVVPSDIKTAELTPALGKSISTRAFDSWKMCFPGASTLNHRPTSRRIQWHLSYTSESTTY